MDSKTIADIKKDYTASAYTPSELVRFYLDRIQQFDSRVHAALEVFGDEAITRAKESDARLLKDDSRPLEGIPFIVKDNILCKGKRTTAGSQMLGSYTAAYSATVVQRLADAGAVILGKSNCDEFAMGASTEFSSYFPTHNPHNLDKVPGGSSGGSVAAVAADFCAAALGSDTGGSVRQPASFCGVVGFKPTYGRVSRFGLIAMCSSLDQIGPATKSVADAATIYAAIAGKDDYDATTIDAKVAAPKFNIHGLKSLTFGIPRTFLEIGIDDEVMKSFEQTCGELQKAGAKLIDIDLPLARFSLPVYYLLVTSEVSSNLARYDGIRYGTAAKDAETLFDSYVHARSSGFGIEAKRRIILGTFALSAGYRDQYYLQALRLKQAIAQQYEDAFKHIDAIVCPTAPTVAFKLGEKLEDPLTMYLSDLFTVPANIANLPAISVPAGKVRGMPFGLQLMAKSFADERLLDIAHTVEPLVGAYNRANLAA